MMVQGAYYAVMGNPIAHSLSPVIHQHFAHSVGKVLYYDRILVESNFEENVHDFFKSGGCGLNITSPFKEEAFRISQVKTSGCQQAGAANTLWMSNGQLHADNTDGIGLCRSLAAHRVLQGAHILILGAGGAARGIIPALQAEGARVTLANRTYEKALALREQFADISVITMNDVSCVFDIILNATSAKPDFSQLPVTWFLNRPYCCDLTYQRDANTDFVLWARSLGCEAVDGFPMLAEQAAEAFYVWHGIRPSQVPYLDFGQLAI